MLRHVSYLVLQLTGSTMLSQNLIPNPGFEDMFTSYEYQWVQPQGAYYHYERTDENWHAMARSGEFMNGICMYHNEPNEYLHVKLMEPLHAGQQYVISAWVRLMRSKCLHEEKQSLIGVHFGDKRLDTHLPGDFPLAPQANFRLPAANRFEWFQVADTFTASGGEQYLTIGYFPATQRAEYIAKKQEDFMKEVDAKAAAKDRRVSDDMAWLYLSPDEQKKYLKKNKKAKSDKSIMDIKEGKTKKPVPAGNKDFLAQGDLSPDFRVRYYFDDFCLVALQPGLEAACEPENVAEIFAPGKTIHLQHVFFETAGWDLLEESLVQLGEMKRLMDSYPGMRVEIRGYTDNVGTNTYNMDLSTKRAKAVAEWLLGQGIQNDRITYKGFGPASPIASNETEAGRALNRRVVFMILEM